MNRLFQNTFFLGTIMLVRGRQLSTAGGDLKWVATIDDQHDCDTMSTIIRSITEGHNHRALLSDGIQITELLGDDNCFIEFSGTYEMAVAINNTEGVIDVDPNEEIILSNNLWHLDRSDQEMLPLDGAPYNPPFTGNGQTLYVLDTGIYKEHSDLIGRAEYGKDVINENPPTDNHGHGTHVASIAAGSNHGIAPNAIIKGVKVLSASGSGTTVGVIEGIQWAVKDAGTQTSVISMSLGGGKSTALNKAATDAAKKHIVVVAAGNENQDACNVSPASAEGNVITVGSTTDQDHRSGFSNWGNCVNIFAPGTSITAAYVGGPHVTKVMSGTSMATPYVAGIALQLLEQYDGDLNDAYNELYNTAVWGVLTGDIGKGSPNLLGLIPTYTGPPTPPTTKPTRPPTRPEPRLCHKNKCFDFRPSKFGKDIWYERDLIYDIAIPAGDKRMCEATNDNFDNKIVIVERGKCLFFDKVKNCEKRGAKAVIIYNDINSEIFEPSYYGSGKVNIPSCMISKKDGQLLYKSVGDELKWGRLDGDTYTPSPTITTTKMPTVSPTERPTRKIKECYMFNKRRCKNRKKRCIWKNQEKTCEAK